MGLDPPPAYDDVLHVGPTPTDLNWAHHDPRSTSQESLVTQNQEQRDKRRLLLIYIHGFMGNEMSFRSFPAHVHNLLAVLLADSHVIHTKLYPRYASKRKITVARDDFSRWLEPHEDANTDVVLLGHSMGGLLCAEIALLEAPVPAAQPLKHRILGTINFDVPFLGLHPGIVKSGLSSIFKPSEETHKDKWTLEEEDAFWAQNDPNYNPAYSNDINLATRKGWQNAWHFISKHQNDLKGATKQLVRSHIEFGSAMANLTELKTRYVRVRSLEEDNEQVRKSVVEGSGVPHRVRFVNFYTASHGRPKAGFQARSNLDGNVEDPSSSVRSRRTSVSASETSQGQDLEDEEESQPAMVHIEPKQEDVEEKVISADSEDPVRARSKSPLPPLPDLPPAPPPLDVSYITDKGIRKLVEKEHATAVKAHEKAIKDREKALAKRAKLAERQVRKEHKEAEDAAKKAAKAERKTALQKPEAQMTHSEKEELRLERERQRMEAEARRMRGEKEPTPEHSTGAGSSSASFAASSTQDQPLSMSSLSLDEDAIRSASLSSEKAAKAAKKGTSPPKDRKFCNLPPKDAQGERDPCWVRIFMEGVDEVGAHCGLFFVDERYERMVGEVAETVERWVHDDPCISNVAAIA